MAKEDTKMEQRNYNAAIYCRLSRDDEQSGNSLSIQNQKTLLTEYAHENGWHIDGGYIDNGVSGTTLVRIDFAGVCRCVRLMD